MPWLRIRRYRSSRGVYPIPVKDAGRSRPALTRACRCLFSPPRYTSASVRAARRILPTSCSRRCAMSSAGTWKNPLNKDKAMSVFHSDALVFFGATGDLAHKKVFPALQAMVKRGHLNVPVIGVAKAGWNLERLRARARESLETHGGVDAAAFDKLSSLLRYVDGDYREPATFDLLRRALGAAERPLHYLAIPSSLFSTVVAGLGRSGCARGGRVVAEKPFGHDLASAQALNRSLLAVFPEPAVFRIDHYLGKEPVENLLYFRFSNSVLESIWNCDHVDSVQITMAESFGIAGRGSFYDQTGAIRDVIENHLLQVVACLAMDAPSSGQPETLR